MANTFNPAKKREKIHWMQGRKEKHTIDAWKKVATIGTRVLYHDQEHVVESHAGLDRHKEASVFISGVEEAVPLRLLYLADPRRSV